LLFLNPALRRRQDWADAGERVEHPRPALARAH